MHVKVLGPVEVESDGERVEASANQRLLLATLAARPGEIVPADGLAEVLWPDGPPRNPQSALHNLVSRLRARLGPDDVAALTTRPPGYGLALDRVAIDHLEFERSLAEARTRPDLVDALSCYDVALGLWRGDAYAEFADAEGIRDDALRLDELRSVTREERLALLVRIDPGAAIAELEALISTSPYRERAHMLLMEALHRNHRQRDALNAYSRYRTMLADELGLDPSDAMQRLEYAILTDALPAADTAENAIAPVSPPSVPDDGQSSPPTSPPSRSPRGNLAARRTSFVGRDAEVERTADLLLGHRLVSLVGVGGAGKTTLATEIARRVADRFPDGTWVVDLVALPSGERIPDHIAGSIGLPRLSSGDPLGSLVHVLDGRTLLLVLDNCEHLAFDVAQVADRLLASSDGVGILATSREALRVPGELVVSVDPLGLPPRDANVADVLASASGRLFVDRVAAIAPSLRVEEEDAPLIASVCRRLDGLPLALELAAARVPTLGLRRLAERLDHRFGLLSSHHRTSVEHHQTLRAAIDWSVDLLDDRERRLLARLGVFIGDFELEAAEDICADDRLGHDEVADALALLVERSLVVMRRDDNVVRYRLLETIRDHATSLLDPEELAEVQRRHRDWYLAFARLVGENFLVQTVEWYSRLRAGFANLRSAFRWSMGSGEVGTALDLATALNWAPFNAGYLYREHQDWIDQSLEAARAVGVDRALLGRGLVAAGSVATLESRVEEAISHLTEAHSLISDTGRHDDLIWCEMWLAAALADAARHREAVEHASVGLSIASSRDATTPVVYLATQHAETAVSAALLLPDPSYVEIARGSYDIAIDAASRAGVEEGLVRAQHGAALLEASTGDPAAALDECIEALVRWRQIGAGARLVLGLTCTARVALLAGDLDTAAALMVEALDGMDQVGWRQPLRRALEVGVVLAVQTDLVEEAGLLEGAAQVRFATPRWYVPLDRVHQVGVAPVRDTAAWTNGVEVGRGLTDDAAAAVARRVGASVGSPRGGRR